MADYKSKQSILDSALGKHADCGFTLVEPDDHVAELYFKGKKIATYYQSTLTIPVLREGCRNFLTNLINSLED